MRRILFAVACSLFLGSTVASGPPARGADPPSVTIWHAYSGSGTAETAAFESVLARVQARYPGIAITAEDQGFQNLFNNYFGNALAEPPVPVPDLMVGPNDSLYWEWQLGIVSDVTPTVSARAETTRRDAVLGSTVDGHVVQIPESLKAVALYYDKRALPAPPTTTAGYLRALQHGVKLGMVGLGSEAYYGYGFYGSFGGRILDASGTCVADQKPGVANALAWMRDAVAAGFVLYPNSDAATAALKAGEVAGFLDGNWRLGDNIAALGRRLGVATGPSGPGGPFRPLVGVDGYVVNPLSPNTPAALTVAKAMTDASAQRTFMNVAGHVPANDAVEITDPRVAAFSLAARQGVVRPMLSEFDAYWGWFPWAYGEVVYNGADPGATVAAACAGMNTENGK